MAGEKNGYQRKRLRELEALGWAVLSIFGFICLWPGDQQWLGSVGLHVHNFTFILLGSLAVTAPLACLLLAVARFQEYPFERFRWFGIGYLLSVVSAGMLLASSDWHTTLSPGWFGESTRSLLFPVVGQVGIVLVGVSGLIVGMYAMELEGMIKDSVIAVAHLTAETAKQWSASWKESRERAPAPKPSAVRREPPPVLTPVTSSSVSHESGGNGSKHPADEPEKKTALTRMVEKLKAPKVKKESVKERKEPAVKAAPDRPASDGAFQLPPFTLLSINEASQEVDERLAQDVGRALVETLKNFGIEAELTGISPGPVITRYELKPAKGVRANRFVGLADDIALSLKAAQVRVVAPIPGKDAVGIEVPNSQWEVVRLRQLLENKNWQKNMILPMALGKAIDGTPIIADLTQAPHMLIAGATGSGKSVCIQSIMMSFLYTKTPDELQLILIDPKRVEFSLFRNIPHLLNPIITDVRLAAETLKALIGEMESRYEKFSQAAVQNLLAYNKKAEEPMPYIVVCIDELAELMLVAAKDVEESIMRLAQLARGVGIHLVVATQRPSVDVITGVIKANLPVRIAFQVASKVDSRTILDANGADALLGRGDMLFLPAGAPKPTRAQSSFVSKEDIEATVEYLKAQRGPQYRDLIAVVQKKAELSGESSEDPAVIRTALQFVKERKRVSTMLLQGALHISYGRAANLVSWMEMRGLIGPGIGAKPRDIHLERIDEFLTKPSTTAPPSA